jgi:hypothetical protein
VGTQQSGEWPPALVAGEFASESAASAFGLLSQARSFFHTGLVVCDAHADALQVLTEVQHAAELRSLRG